MSQANVTLALVGPGWHVREKGEDWVRDKLLGAIKAGNPVLPVLVGNADELKVRLGDPPVAFQQQAVTVISDPAGFDLHKVACWHRAAPRSALMRSPGSWHHLHQKPSNRAMKFQRVEIAAECQSPGKAVFER